MAAQSVAYTLLQTTATDNADNAGFVCGYSLVTGATHTNGANVTCAV
ncbi:MAG: hypothetical protein ACKVHU_14085 [Acidimicrobiales bacterium]|jgi:hypothetical protein